MTIFTIKGTYSVTIDAGDKKQALKLNDTIFTCAGIDKHAVSAVMKGGRGRN